MKPRLTMMLLMWVIVISPPAFAKAADEVGVFEFLPFLSISRTSDDNLFAQPNNVEEDRLSRYQPSLEFYGRKGHNSFSISYEGDFGKHDHNPHDDYDDHAFLTDLKFDGFMNDFDMSVSYAKVHEKRGDGLSEGVAALLRSRYDQYNLKRVSGVWEFGADSFAGFQVLADRSYIDYTNNFLVTQYYSRQEDTYSGRLYSKAGSSMKAFAEYTRRNLVYNNDIAPGVTRDSKEDGYFVGFEWFFSDTTSGVIKAGKIEKDFQYVDPALVQFDLDAWDVEMSYAPLPTSVFTLASSRYFKESNGTGSFFITRENSLRWKHHFSSSLSLSMSVLRGIDFFQNETRMDKRKEGGVLIEYDISGSVVMGFGYQYQDVESIYDWFDYDRETFYFEIKLH